jgi:hypothetical protein
MKRMYRYTLRNSIRRDLERLEGAHRAEYHAAFECLGESWDPDADVTPFMSAHVEAQRRQARDVLAE